jgi:hypothetical protein
MHQRVYGKTGAFEKQVEVKHEEEEKHKPLIGQSPFDMSGLKQQSFSTDAQAVHTQVARNPATQYLVLNSRDRNQTSSTGQYVRQPWNQFRLQRPQNIMQTYATRMLISEINFPFYVPNVNNLNNTFWIGGLSLTTSAFTIYECTLSVGYYGFGTLAGTNQLVTAINALLSQTPGVVTQYGVISPINGGVGQLQFPPTFQLLNDYSFQWVRNANPLGVFSLYFYAPNLTNTNIPEESVYYSTANFLSLIGMDYTTVIGGLIGVGVYGNPTTLQYTQYIDIVSDKLHQYSTNRDGSTDNFFSRNLLCRLYISDESSNIVQGGTQANPIQFVPGVTGSMIIHRQFKNPKAVMWNKESAVDWLDISVYDQFGNLIPDSFVDFPAGFTNIPRDRISYPDFQITLLASEN